MTDFEDLMQAWDVTVREFQRHAVILDSACDIALEENVADILCSALVEDCIGRGKPIKEGGAVYDFISGLQVGIANLGDSLAAIKKCVFEDQTITTAEAVGRAAERLRRRPRRGDPAAARQCAQVRQRRRLRRPLLVRAYDSCIDEIVKHHNTRYGRGPIGGGYYAGTSSISANVPQGASTMATPDGRNAGEPLAEGCSPSHGADTNGPTAVFKSVSKLPTDRITGGVLLNQKVTPQVLRKEADRQAS